MDEYILSQIYAWFIFFICGIIIGLLFDLFRILRKTFKTSDILTYIEDASFWLITGLILMYTIFTYNNGEIRLYILISIMLGFMLYIFTISKYIIKISVKILKIIKQIIYLPIKCIINIAKKIIFNPISFIIINLRKNFTSFYHKFAKISHNKKDLQN